MKHNARTEFVVGLILYLCLKSTERILITANLKLEKNTQKALYLLLSRMGVSGDLAPFQLMVFHLLWSARWFLRWCPPSLNIVCGVHPTG